MKMTAGACEAHAVRCEECDTRHGARFAAAGAADMDEDDGWGV